jgi:hypothetical protein
LFDPDIIVKFALNYSKKLGCHLKHLFINFFSVVVFGAGTGTAGTVSVCWNWNWNYYGSGSGSGTGFGSGSIIKCNKNLKIKNERPTF